MNRARYIPLLIALFLVLRGGTSETFAQKADTARFVAMVSRFVESVNRLEYDSVRARYSADLQKSLPIAKTKLLFQRLLEQSGRIVRHGPPRIVSPRQANTVLGLERGVQELQMYLDADGKISGFVLLAKSDVPPTKSFLDSLAPDPSPAPTVTETPPAAPAEAPPAVAAATVPQVSPPEPEKPQPAPVAEVSKKIESPASVLHATKPDAAPSLPVSLPVSVTDQQGSPAATPPPSVSEKPRTPPADPSPGPSVAAPATPEPAKALRDKQQTPIYPPFHGEWFVIAGGQDAGESTGRNLLTQQYAYEFGAQKNNERFRGKGTKLEDYYAFGQEVLAPAAGVVVEAVDGIPDNDPGTKNPYALIGNAVVIRHTDREYSVLAFLKRGSVKVRVGDAVQRGQVIGLCGSSGAATEPSLHFHLQNSSRWSSASTVKFYFEQVGISSGEGLSGRRDHSPVAGDRLRWE